MKTLLVLAAIIGLSMMYLNRDTLFPGRESEYCKAWYKKVQSDSDYQSSYGERVKVTLRGCF